MRRLAASIAGVIVVVACSSVPKYPACERDEQCAVSGKHDYCVAGKCVYCRVSTDCADRERCRAGKCEADPDLPPPKPLDAGDDGGDASDDEDGGTEAPSDDEETDKTPASPRQMPRGIRRYLHP